VFLYQKTLVSLLTVDLSTVLGNNDAYIGFTGATGANSSTQIINNFSYSNSVPEPASIALLAAGLVGFETVRRISRVCPRTR
jgi:hypothetical protein